MIVELQVMLRAAMTRLFRFSPTAATAQPSMAVELRRRGGSRELVRWAEANGPGVVEACKACLRGTWALETAVRFGVAQDLLEHVVTDWTRDAAKRGLLRLPADRARVEELGAQLAGPEPDIEEWILTMETFAHALIDLDPEVREARARAQEAQRFGKLADKLREGDAYDLAIHLAHRHLAALVLRRIPADLVEVSLRGVTAAHPYR